MARNHSEAPKSSPPLAVGGDWSGLEVTRAWRRLAVCRTDGDDDGFVAQNPQNEEAPAEGPWADWVALARAILEREGERAAMAAEP